MQTVVNSLANALNMVITFIPRLIGFALILLVGWLIAYFISKALVLLLRKVGFDRMSQRIGLTRFEGRMGVKMDSAGILGKVVFWFILLIFLVPAADALGVPAVSNILNQLVAYIPNVFVAILVLFLGSLAGTVVADLVRGTTASAKIGNPNLFANIARFAIIGFAALIALEQLQIAIPLINELFGGIVLAVSLAFALAFGLGGQESARRWLNRGENTLNTAASQIQMQQQNEQQQQQLQQQQFQQQQLQQQQLQQQAAQAPVMPPDGNYPDANFPTPTDRRRYPQ